MLVYAVINTEGKMAQLSIVMVRDKSQTALFNPFNLFPKGRLPIFAVHHPPA